MCLSPFAQLGVRGELKSGLRCASCYTLRSRVIGPLCHHDVSVICYASADQAPLALLDSWPWRKLGRCSRRKKLATWLRCEAEPCDTMPSVRLLRASWCLHDRRGEIACLDDRSCAATSSLLHEDLGCTEGAPRCCRTLGHRCSRVTS